MRRVGLARVLLCFAGCYGVVVYRSLCLPDSPFLDGGQRLPITLPFYICTTIFRVKLVEICGGSLSCLQ